jgi:hypothetical protein
MDRYRFVHLLFALALVSGAGNSVIAAEIRASGAVNLPGTALSDNELEPAIAIDPFTRSLVSVARNGSNYSYFASSDIGLTELRAFGQITNDTGDNLSEIEIGLVRASARLQDTLTFTSESTEDYSVVFELDVDGMTDFSGGSGFAGANLSTGPLSDQNAFFNTQSSGLIDETLSVTRIFNGTIDMTLTMQLFLQLNVANAGAALTAELDNTATLRVILPAGVTIAASESGTFMQVIPAPIPLPAALPLFMMGVLGLTSLRRRA